jgi:hypothetical protein
MSKKMYGELLPNAKIDRIMLENDGPSSMKVDVDISISYKNNARAATDWLDTPDFKKYVKIKILQSTSQEATNQILSKLSIGDLAGILDYVHDDVEEKYLTIDDILNGDKPYEFKNSSEDSISKLLFRRKFDIESTNNPSHLSYFSFTHLDVLEINKEHGTDLTNDIAPIGSVFSELVIKNKSVFGRSYLFYTPD